MGPIRDELGCRQFALNMCRFRKESCWYKHELENETNMEEENDSTRNKAAKETESVFQKVSDNLEPPLINQQQKKKKRKQD